MKTTNHKGHEVTRSGLQTLSDGLVTKNDLPNEKYSFVHLCVLCGE